MELRNWEFYVTGNAVVGADVYVYEAGLTHPTATAVLASTTTNGDGMWAFTGLTDTAKDVKVVFDSKAKWYKGLTKHSVGIVFIDDHETADFAQFVGQASVAAPAAGLGRVYFKTGDSRPYQQYGAIGELPVTPTLSHARVYHNAAQSLTNNANTTLAFNTERLDTDAYHDTATNNSRLIAPVTGVYMAGAHVEIQTSAVGIRQAAIFRSDGAGVAVQRFSASSAGETVLSVTTGAIEMTAAQYLEVLVFQDSGGAINCNAGSATNQYKADFWITRIK